MTTTEREAQAEDMARRMATRPDRARVVGQTPPCGRGGSMNQPGAPLESRGWFRCHRSEAGMELLKANPLAFVLLYVIARRARWADGFNRHGLAKGEAFIGDFESYGMTEQNYRTAKAQLAKWKFATFKPTNKGTVAALTDTSVFSVSTMHDNGQSNDRVTDSQRTANGRVTTNLESKKERREESSKLQRAKPNESTPPAKSDDHRTIAADTLDEKGLDEKGFDRSGQDLNRLNDAVEDEMARAGGHWRDNQALPATPTTHPR